MISEDKLYEALGLDKPSGNDQEVAEPEEETEEEAQETGAAEEAGGEETEDGNDGNSPGEGDGESTGATGDAETDGGEKTAKPPQTKEERRENAERRRRQERQAAIDKAVEDALRAEREKNRETIEGIFRRAGLSDSVSGEPIRTLEDFDNWEKSFKSERMKQELEEGKLTRETIDELIAQNPAVKRAEELQRRQAEEERARREREAKARIEKEIGEIHRLDPGINSVEDLTRMENFQEFYGYVQKGNSYLDAYYLANREKLTEKRAQAAKQAAMNNARGKDHLKGTGNARGSGAVSVPAEERKLFKLLNPKATEEEMRAYYNSYKKGQ